MLNKITLGLRQGFVLIALGIPAIAVEADVLVKNIQVQGLVNLKPQTVLYDLPVKAGQVLKSGQETEIIKKLYATGLYSNVEVSSQGAGLLLIKLEEKPLVREFTLNGVKDKDKLYKTLRQEAGLAGGHPYDPASIVKARQILSAYYIAKGHYGVKVDPVVQNINSKQVDISLDVYEGTEARIKKINITGNNAFSESELLGALTLTAPSGIGTWFNNNDKYKKEKLEIDLENIRSYYMDRGYVNAQVLNSQVSITPDKKDIYITLHVEEGDQYDFGQVEISGELPVSRTKLDEKLASLEAGTVFSRKKLLDVKQALEDVLGHAGFSMSEVRPIPNIDPIKKIVHVNYQVSPAKRVYVRRIEIQGNDITQDQVIRRELPQMEGTWISTSLLEEGKRNLMRRGFTKEVEIETVPVEGQENLVDVIYKVQEEKVREVSAGVSYSTAEKVAFRFGLAQRNFLGTGKDVDFVFENSKASTTYSLNYNDPYFTKDGIGFGSSVYFKKLDLSNAVSFSDYATDTYGASGYFVFPFSKETYGSFGLGYDNTHLKPSGISALEYSEFINKHGTRYNDYYLTTGLGFDNLDQLIFPTQGMSHGLNLRWSTPASTLKYYVLKYEGDMYQPLWASNFIFNLKASAGYGNAYGSTERLPFFKNFYAGGIGSVRGYDENSLGPKDSRGYPFGGNLVGHATAALIFPNPIKPDIKSVRTSVFLDVGQVYDTEYKYRLVNGEKIRRNPTSLRYSAGLALQWHTPIGFPLVLSLAKPLNLKPGDKKRSFSFTFGAVM
ncbi:MAG: outer membrane protein assembly factor BamA [Gammaproteobacteria bacterium]